MTSAPRPLDCFTIALGKKTGTTFPITFDNKHNYNALYDTGTGASLINYSAYVSLGQDLDTGYQPFMKNASGEDMGALGQVTCTFTINDQPFTQSFIVCRNMQRPVILGTDFTSMNFVGVIWTHEGTRKMIRSNRSTVMELPDTTSGVPLVLAQSVKIRPGDNLEVPLECTRQLTDQMDIRIDTGFHHKNPNIYVVPPQSWGDRSDTKHSKCLLLGGRRLNQLTLIPKPKGSGGARAATAQVGPANNRNDTKRCLPVEASLRPGEAVPW